MDRAPSQICGETLKENLRLNLKGVIAIIESLKITNGGSR